MRWFLALFCLALGILSGCTELPCLCRNRPISPPSALESEIDSLFRDFDGDSLEVRAASADRLIALGKRAVPRIQQAVEAARSRGNAEAESRGRDVLEAIESLRWFPLDVDYRWVYSTGSDSHVVFQVLRKIEIEGHPCFAIERTWGDEKLIFTVSVSHKGVRIHKVGDTSFVPPFLEVAFPMRFGERWTWEGTLGDSFLSICSRNIGREEIRVPAGLFLTYRIEEVSTGTTLIYLAEDVGVVELTGKESDVHNSKGGSFDWKLVSFSRPPER